MTRVLQLCTLAGIVTGLLALTVPAFAQTGWTVVPPPAGTAGDELTGSYALSNTDAWAVGYIGNTSTGPETPVALNWNGTAWSPVSTPTPSGSTPDWGFESVEASGTSDAWAVGEQSAGTKIHDSLYEHWNGTAWSVVSGAVPALQVSADSPDDIWGISRDDMVTHYNGTSWSSTTLSAPSGTAIFEGVAALSPADVWVVGASTSGAPIAEQFNGTSWHVVTLPSSFSSYGLNAITAQSASDIWVFSNTGSPSVPLLLGNWNGSSWTTSPSPLPADSDVSIGSAASSSSHVWLFGTGPNSDNPLILSNDS